MAGIALDRALTTGHSSAPPTVVLATQDHVIIEGRRAVVEGDRIIEHNYHDKPPHGGTVICHNNNIFIMGKKVAQVGDKITCGDTISEGSSISVMR